MQPPAVLKEAVLLELESLLTGLDRVRQRVDIILVSMKQQEKLLNSMDTIQSSITDMSFLMRTLIIHPDGSMISINRY